MCQNIVRMCIHLYKYVQETRIKQEKSREGVEGGGGGGGVHFLYPHLPRASFGSYLA